MQRGTCQMQARMPLKSIHSAAWLTAPNTFRLIKLRTLTPTYLTRCPRLRNLRSIWEICASGETIRSCAMIIRGCFRWREQLLCSAFLEQPMCASWVGAWKSGWLKIEKQFRDPIRKDRDCLNQIQLTIMTIKLLMQTSLSQTFPTCKRLPIIWWTKPQITKYWTLEPLNASLAKLPSQGLACEAVTSQEAKICPLRSL